MTCTELKQTFNHSLFNPVLLNITSIIKIEKRVEFTHIPNVKVNDLCNRIKQSRYLKFDFLTWPSLLYIAFIDSSFNI
jgi:hypothetical protein